MAFREPLPSMIVDEMHQKHRILSLQCLGAILGALTPSQLHANCFEENELAKKPSQLKQEIHYCSFFHFGNRRAWTSGLSRSAFTITRAFRSICFGGVSPVSFMTRLWTAS